MIGKILNKFFSKKSKGQKKPDLRLMRLEHCKGLISPWNVGDEGFFLGKRVTVIDRSFYDLEMRRVNLGMNPQVACAKIEIGYFNNIGDYKTELLINDQITVLLKKPNDQ